MILVMNFRPPTDQDIHTAFAQGEAAVRDLVHALATQIEALAQQLAKQGEALQALQARLAQNSRNSSKPPSSDGYGKVKRTESIRKPGEKPNGGQPGHDGPTLSASANETDAGLGVACVDWNGIPSAGKDWRIWW